MSSLDGGRAVNTAPLATQLSGHSNEMGWRGKTAPVRPVRSDGDEGETLDQCHRLSGREMRRSMVPR